MRAWTRGSARPSRTDGWRRRRDCCSARQVEKYIVDNYLTLVPGNRAALAAFERPEGDKVSMLNVAPADTTTRKVLTHHIRQTLRSAANDADALPRSADYRAASDLQPIGDILKAAYSVSDQPFDLGMARLCLRLKRTASRGAGAPSPIDQAMPMMTMPSRTFMPMARWP